MTAALTVACKRYQQGVSYLECITRIAATFTSKASPCYVTYANAAIVAPDCRSSSKHSSPTYVNKYLTMLSPRKLTRALGNIVPPKRMPSTSSHEQLRVSLPNLAKQPQQPINHLLMPLVQVRPIEFRHCEEKASVGIPMCHGTAGAGFIAWHTASPVVPQARFTALEISMMACSASGSRLSRAEEASEECPQTLMLLSLVHTSLQCFRLGFTGHAILALIGATSGVSHCSSNPVRVDYHDWLGDLVSLQFARDDFDAA